MAQNIDCMHFMRAQSMGSFDLTVGDPPYFSGPNRRKYYGSLIRRHTVLYPELAYWEVPGADYFEQVKRVSKNWIIWGYNYFEFCHVGKFKTPRGNEIKTFIQENSTGWIVWDKCNPGTSFNDYELAFTSYNRPTTIFRFMWNGMMQGKSISEGHIMRGNKAKNQARIHPTEKPIELYQWIFKEYTTPGMRVLDTHLGSGSSRLAALDFDIDFYGTEIDPMMFEKANKRYRDITSQLRIPLNFSQQ